MLIYGAGPLGCLYVVKLHQAGHDVTLLARGKWYNTLKENGLKLYFYLTKERLQLKVPVVNMLHPDDEYDLIIVIMRKSYVYDILPILAQVKLKPIILFLGNNLTGIYEYSKYLPAEHLLLGFPNAAGYRKNDEIIIVYSEKSTITLGEIDGSYTPRLRKIVDFFKTANLHTHISSNIDAWLKCHIALVSPIANALYSVGSDFRAFAYTPDALLICIHGMLEGFQVLKKLGYPILPKKLRLMSKMPVPLLYYMFRRIMRNKDMRTALEAHSNITQAELGHLTKEFYQFVEQTNIPVPAIDFLMKYVVVGTQEVDIIPYGSKKLSLWKKCIDYQKILFTT